MWRVMTGEVERHVNESLFGVNTIFGWTFQGVTGSLDDKKPYFQSV